MAYRVIACSVGDYSPDITLDEILLLDENEQGYFEIFECESLEEANRLAIDELRQWCQADIDLADDVKDEAMKEIFELRNKEIQNLKNIGIGKVVSSGSTDWVRIEEV